MSCSRDCRTMYRTSMPLPCVTEVAFSVAGCFLRWVCEARLAGHIICCVCVFIHTSVFAETFTVLKYSKWIVKTYGVAPLVSYSTWYSMIVQWLSGSPFDTLLRHLGSEFDSGEHIFSQNSQFPGRRGKRYLPIMRECSYCGLDYFKGTLRYGPRHMLAPFVRGPSPPPLALLSSSDNSSYSAVM